MFFSLCNFILIGTFISFASLINSDPLVTTNWATIKGVYVTVQSKNLAVFTNIPYAQPPIGNLRFAPPQPLTGTYPGVFDGTQNQTNCYAMPSAFDVLVPKINESENCLVLNIWTHQEAIGSSTLKPVLIYIHGGAYFTDANRSPFFVPDVLAAKGDMIVVTMKYRLGIFGCAYAGTDDIPGNVNIQDQAMAIKWVGQNIENFGGDPSQITVGGQSAGGESTTIHYLNPDVNQYISKIILDSSSIYINLQEDTSRALQRFKVTAQSANCWTDNDMDQTVACLKNVNATSLINAYMTTSTLFAPEIMPMCMVEAGPNSELMATQKLLAGNINKKIPALMTNMADEGSVLLAIYAVNTTNDPEIEAKKYLSTGIPGITQAEIDDLIEIYFARIISNPSYEKPKALLRLLGDRHFTCPITWFGESIISHANAYHARFQKISTNLAAQQPALIFDQTYGAKHGASMIYCK